MVPALFFLSFFFQRYRFKQVNVSYYTVLKFIHVRSSFLLSSVPFFYGSGSQQQVTRSVTDDESADTYWTIYPLSNETNISEGNLIQCGNSIRIRHESTGCWLHSHNITFYNELGNEVSCFYGDDTGNIWKVICEGNFDNYNLVKFEHIDTHQYLFTNNSDNLISPAGADPSVYSIDDFNGDIYWRVTGGMYNEDL